MENIKIETIIPSSISDISYANEESDFGGYSIGFNNKNGDRTYDYQIKVNGPDGKDNEISVPHNEDNNNNAHQRLYLGIQNRESHIRDENALPRSEKIEYKEKVTGYEINKECFSEEELLKAFKIFDVSKDEIITEEDLIFVLDYMKEEYTAAEVKEMITMLSPETHRVNFEDFKKLGQGHILPLANFKIPEPDMKLKQQILENLEDNSLLEEDPEQVMELLKNGMISYVRFQQFKNRAKANNSTLIYKYDNYQVSTFLKNVPIRSPEQFRYRKQMFMTIVVVDPRDLLKHQVNRKQETASLAEISSILEISQKEAKDFYPNAQTYYELVFLETIAFSRLKVLEKFELGLGVINQEESVQFCEVVHLLQVLKGRDESIENKLKAICLNSGMPIKNNARVSKIEMVQILSSHLSSLFF